MGAVAEYIKVRKNYLLADMKKLLKDKSEKSYAEWQEAQNRYEELNGMEINLADKGVEL